MMRRSCAALFLFALGCQPEQRRALILDLALSDPALIAGTAEPWTTAGYAVDYRRGYPHLTHADLARYRTVILLGGRGPERPTDAIDAGDLALLTSWLPQGGVLILGYAGDGEGFADRRTMNRWLGALGAGLRIGDFALADTTAPPDGAPVPAPLARLVTGALRLPGLTQFTAGRAHVLVVASPRQVLARASPDAFVRPRGGSAEPRPDAPVVAAARVGDGLVVIASRHLLGVAGPELRAATVSPASTGARDAAREFLVALARWTRRPAEWASLPPARAAPLVAVADTPTTVAVRIPPLEAPTDAGATPLPLAPPPPDTVTAPGWVRRQGLRIGWVRAPLARNDVGLDAQAAALDSLLAFLDDAGLNVLAAPAGAPLLADTGRTAARPRSFSTLAWRQAAERIGATSVRWYATLSLDATGPADAGPCLLDDRRWTEGIRPALRELAVAARDHAGAIAGVAVELAPDTAGLTCDADYAAALAVLGRDSAWTAQRLTLPPAARYTALRDAGELPAYLDALERALAARAAAAADDARRVYAGLQFALHAREPLADWRAFGLARGLAAGDGTVQLWDGEPDPAPIVAAHRRRGTVVLHALGVATRMPPRWWPRARATVFEASDGFWIGPLDPVLGGAPDAPAADSLSRSVGRLVRDR